MWERKLRVPWGGGGAIPSSGALYVGYAEWGLSCILLFGKKCRSGLGLEVLTSEHADFVGHCECSLRMQDQRSGQGKTSKEKSGAGRRGEPQPKPNPRKVGTRSFNNRACKLKGKAFAGCNYEPASAWNGHIA